MGIISQSVALTVIGKAIPIILGILIFGVSVLVHEFGHYYAAVKNDIKVLEFAIGMGPKLFSFTKGETLFSIRAIPMGGFCRVLGEESEDEATEADKHRTLYSKKVWQRMVFVVAGAFMNFVLAVILFFCCSFLYMHSTNEIQSVADNYPAMEAGLLPNDKVLKINGDKVMSIEEINIALYKSRGQKSTFLVKRGGELKEFIITPKKTEQGFKVGALFKYKAGLLLKDKDNETVKIEKTGFANSVIYGFNDTYFYFKMGMFGITELISGKIPLNGLSGPIGVVSYIGESYEKGIKESKIGTYMEILNFAGVLSASIGFFNLLPLPALDGGRLFFLVIEAITRKQIPPEKEGYVHFVGFVLLMLLGLFVAYNDILNLGK